ncbi:MAG: NUDIX hydrolase [Actinomycetota bacterium]
MKTRFEHSAGGVVFRESGDAPEVVLASRRNRAGALVWGLPKGIVEPGEQPDETAVREVEEETGLTAEIDRPLGDISYWYVWGGQRIRKTVTFFLMRATGGDTSRHDKEMEEVRWFRIGVALKRAGYPSERDVIRRAAQAVGATD